MGDWNPRANDIFLKAVDLSDLAELAKFVAAECAGDAALGLEVDALLKAHGQVDGMLENSPADGLFQSLSVVPAMEKVGSVVGPYKLLSVIGEGGMGTVYSAEQTSPVRRFVAVKVIKAGMDTRKVIARFEAERQALALMDHPNIAKVLDAGSTPTGRPFFVMELVDGVPITDYCDREKLTPARRIELFLPVCRAIQHAHQKGIIHRDIKPTNVLVGVYDGTPIPKVIDFGIAKATARRPTDETDMTAFGAVVGTLQYMSPEQAVTGDQDVDTRSDVYSLGVLLYELLTGSTPVTKDSLRDAAMAEALRVIREKDPPRPSTRLSEAGTLVSVAATRGTEPARLTGILRGELDWIVMKALEKDRARRYDSANGLALDLLRYQADEPVTAHPPSMGYRISKTFRRHRAVVLTGAAMAALLVAGAGVSTWQAVRATREKNEKESARYEAVQNSDRARKNEVRATEAATAERLAREDSQRRLDQLQKADAILASIFKDLDPKAATLGGSSIQQQLANLLVRAAGQFDGDGMTGSESLLQMQATIGQSLTDLSHAREAIGPLTKAYDGFTRLKGPHSDESLHAGSLLMNAFKDAGESEKAVDLATNILNQTIEAHGSDSTAAINATNDLGCACLSADKFDKAVEQFSRARDLCRDHLTPDDPLTARCVGNLASAYSAAGQGEKSVGMLEEVVALSRAKTGSDSLTTLGYELNLAAAYQSVGHPERTIPLLKHVVDREKVKLGPNHRDTITAMNNLAEAYQETGQIDQAVELYEVVVRRSIDVDGPDHPSTYISISNLAMAYLAQHHPERARPMMEKVVADSLKRFGPDHASTLQAQHNLAGIYLETGQSDKAVDILEDTLHRATAVLGPDHPTTLMITKTLGQCYCDVKRGHEAAALFTRLTAKVDRLDGPYDNRSIRMQGELGLALLVDRRPAEAKAAFEERIRRLKVTAGPDDTRMADAMIELAAAQLDNQEPEAAEKTADDALLIYHKALSDRILEYAGKVVAVESIFDKRQCYGPAEKYLEEALDIRSKAIPDVWVCFYTKSQLGDLLARQKKFDVAEPLLREGYQGMTKRLRQIPPSSMRSYQNAAGWLAALYNATDRHEQALVVQSDYRRLTKSDDLAAEAPTTQGTAASKMHDATTPDPTTQATEPGN